MELVNDRVQGVRVEMITTGRATSITIRLLDLDRTARHRAGESTGAFARALAERLHPKIR